MEEIFEIILEDNKKEFDEETVDVVTKDSVTDIKKDINKLLSNAKCNVGSVEYASLNKMLALCHLKVGDEISAIHCLVESHATILRQQIMHRFSKTELRESLLETPQTYGLNSSYVKFSVNDNDALRSKLVELPQEWYMIQVTGQYESVDKTRSKKMHPVHITILPTGSSNMEPLCITLPKPKSSFCYDVCSEIQRMLSSNRSELNATYASNELYWKMRERQNVSMKKAVHELENTWLREWRILFMADPIDNDLLVTDLLGMIDKLISDYEALNKNISGRTRWLLKKIVLGACFLTREEIARAVKYVVPADDKLAANIILSIFGRLTCIKTLREADRKTLILIVDEHMDYIPFESMEILRRHPVTRFPSLHIAYALFKEHEDEMENGCRIINAKNDMGTCIVNPGGDLGKMEKRMKLFIEHWLPQWKSCFHVEPKAEDFEDALINNHVLMYNGHGNGIQYLPGQQIEKLKVKSIVLLFGCSSVKLLSIGGRYPPYGISNQYLMASSPCILGMLWEVTDADIDKMTANFISSWIPSESAKPWTDVDINTWCAGSLKFQNRQENSSENAKMEPEMLRAVAKSKDVCSQFMTAAAIIVRGLPVKLFKDKKS